MNDESEGLLLPKNSQPVSREQVRRGGTWAASPLFAPNFALSFGAVSAAPFFGALIARMRTAFNKAAAFGPLPLSCWSRSESANL